MKNKKESFKIKGARRLITDLSLILGLTSVLGAFVPKNNNTESYNKEISIESEALYSSNDISFDEEELNDYIVEDVHEIEYDNEEEQVIDEESTNIEENTYEMPNIASYEGKSIVDALELNGYDSSFEYRTELANKLGIKNYKGTAKQNIKLIRLLKNNNKEITISIAKIETQDIKENKVVKATKTSDKLFKVYKDGKIQTIPVELSKDEKNDILKKATKKWQAYDDNLEFRKNPKTKKIEFRKHSYQKNWKTTKYDNIAKDCLVCKHRKYKHKHSRSYSKWMYLDEENEYRVCSCEKTQTRPHKLNDNWLYNKEFDLDYKICSGCGIEIKRPHECIFTEWSSLDDNYEHRYCSVCEKEEKRLHLYGDKFEANGEEYETCINCKHIKKVTTNSNSNGNSGHGGGSGSSSGGNTGGYTPTPSHTHNYVYDYYNNDFEKGVCTSNPGHVITRGHSVTEWSRLNDTTECGLCSTCGHTITRPCVFTFDHFEYEPNNDFETHKRLTYQKCALDGNVNVISEAAVNCTVSTAGFTYTPGKDYEEGLCADCGQEIHKDHDLELISTTYEQDTTDPEHPTHKIIKNYGCVNDAYTKEVLSESIACTPNTLGFKYNSSTGLDEATCLVCGGKIVRSHEHIRNTTPVIVPISDSSIEQHREEYHCTECNALLDSQTVSCEYDNSIYPFAYDQVSEGIHTKKSTCIKCEAEKHKNESCNRLSDITYTTNAIDKKHNEERTCLDCGNTITNEADCEYDNNQIPFVYNSKTETTHDRTSTCIKCGDSVTEELDCNFNNTLPITSNATIGKHNENTKCEHCDNVKTEEKDCTNLSELKYSQVDDYNHKEYKTCLDCNDIAEENLTAHKHNDYRNKDDSGADVYCACGHSDRHTHVFNAGDIPYQKEDGNYYLKCAEGRCGYEVKQAVIEHTHTIRKRVVWGVDEDDCCYTLYEECTDPLCPLEDGLIKKTVVDHNWGDPYSDTFDGITINTYYCKGEVPDDYKDVAGSHTDCDCTKEEIIYPTSLSSTMSKNSGIINEKLPYNNEDIYDDVKIKTLAKRNPYSII